MKRNSEIQLICGKRRCRNGLKARADLGRYRPSQYAVGSSKTLDFIDSQEAVKVERSLNWAIAVNRAHVYAPRDVLDEIFGRLP